jgi:drug/metabolite transporter (DMT)-like permease
MIFGLILLAVGIIALLVKLDVLSGSVWSYTWPAILIILGVYFIFGRRFWRHHPRRWFGWYPPDDRDRDKKE